MVTQVVHKSGVQRSRRTGYVVKDPWQPRPRYPTTSARPKLGRNSEQARGNNQRRGATPRVMVNPGQQRESCDDDKGGEQPANERCVATPRPPKGNMSQAKLESTQAPRQKGQGKDDESARQALPTSNQASTGRKEDSTPFIQCIMCRIAPGLKDPHMKSARQGSNH